MAQKNAKQTAKPESFCTPPRKPQPKCPECHSKRLYRDGLRYLANGETVQRWLCRECGYRFSDPNQKKNCNGSGLSQHVQKIQRLNLKTLDALTYSCQVGARKQSGARNLVEVETRQEKVQREDTKPSEATVKGKLVQFSWWMTKQGYAKETIRGYVSCLRTLWDRGANIYDEESVKDVMARQKWSGNRKRNVINAYSLFLKMEGLTWKKPRCKVTQKIPFIPTQEEIDALIAGCGKKTSTFLQLLKETAMRSGEAKSLLWTDIDSKRRMITLNNPEKGSNARAWKVSGELIGMLNALPKKSQRVFGDGSVNSLKTTFCKARKRLAGKLQNLRLLRISFHTFRHWKATTLYHQTRDPWYVKDFLGHKSIRSTEIYITIERTIFEPSSDEFTVRVTSKPEEVKALLETGFDYVCEKDKLVFLRKRK